MNNSTTQSIKKGRFGLTIMLVALIVLGIPAIAHIYSELRWYRSVNHDDIFLTILTTQLLLGSTVGLFVALVLLGNLRTAIRLSRGMPPLYLHDPEGVARVDMGTVATRSVMPIVIAIGLLSGLINVRHWDTCLKFFQATPFGDQDPIFGRDISFYIFHFPFLEAVSSALLWTLGTAAVTTSVIYWARGAVSVTAGKTNFYKPARTHLSILVALIFLVLAFEGYLDLSRLLYSTVGPMTGASFADVNAKLPALRVKIAIAVVASVLVTVSISRERLNLAIAGVVLYLAVQLFGVELYPSMVHRFSVEPNEYEKEAPYLQHNIIATRAAYGLDKVIERDLKGETSLSREDILNNQDTIDNIRLWDHQPLLDAFAQIQEIRTYYDFHSVDNDRYIINSKLKQTMLSARELSSESLPNRTWINERFHYTHGYGLTLGPVNIASKEGLPVLLIQDIPPVSAIDTLKVTQPAIYYGELSNDYVFVKTRNQEFHHPSAEGNVYTNYKGKGGIRFDSMITRLAIATRLGSLRLLLSNDIESNSRVLMYRNIKERVSHIAPFLHFDHDPYMVVRDDGTLIWIFDAYTTSSYYPYAEPMESGLNYIRNSVKIVIDAYNGSVTLYIADDKDPLLRTWRRIFPHAFVPLSEMPADIRAHLRYPEQIFQIQTSMFTIYHMDHPQLLYSREDQWEIPTISSGETRQMMEPYYTIMKPPGESKAEFILMLPFTPKRKDNLAAWMVAQSDGEKLGTLLIYRFPKDRLVFGPQQIVNRINQDAEISRQISLWDQRGSEAIFGTLLVIPIEESLIYVRPLYLRSEGGKIPELKRVIVVYENQITMRPSLHEAVNAIFGKPDSAEKTVDEKEKEPSQQTETATAETFEAQKTTPSSEVEVDIDPRVRAMKHFENAIKAQRRGDWSTYGSELEQVEKYLRIIQPQGLGQQ